MQYQVQAERVIRFLGVFASHRIEGHEEDYNSFLDELLLQLLAAASVQNKAVRFRTCQMLGSIMDQLHEDADLSEVLPAPIPAACADRSERAVLETAASAGHALQSSILSVFLCIWPWASLLHKTALSQSAAAMHIWQHPVENL